MSRELSDRLHDYGLSVVMLVLVATLLRVAWWSVRELVARWM